MTCFLLSNVIVISAQTVDVSLPDLSDTTGASVMIPVNVSDLTGLDVFSYNMKISFDSTVLKPTGVSITGTVTAPWGSVTSALSDSQVVIAAAGSSTLSGSGELIAIIFDVIGNSGAKTDLVFEVMQFNEGTPAANTTNGSFTVIAFGLYEDWWSAFPGAHRGTGVCPITGRVYVSNTTDKKINYFKAGNTTGVPDGYFENAGWAAWLGPYGIDVADDGNLYIATYGATKSVFQVTFGGVVTKIMDMAENMRALTVYGGGVNTVVYILQDGGKVYKLTTDGTTWTKQTLFTVAGQNASIAVTPDGNTIYTVGYNTVIHKYDAAGNEDPNFTMSPTSAIAVRMNEDGSKLFAMFNIVEGASSSAYIGELDPATGEVLSRITVGPQNGVSPVYNVVNSFDILDDRDFFWSSAGGYRGKAIDGRVTVPNRPPFAHVGMDQVIEIFNEVTLDGSKSTDIDVDPITFSWTVVSAPEAVTLSDPTAAMPTFTPMATGDYVFQLVVNDGQLDSPPAEVTITVFQKDLNLTFDIDKDRNRDIPNWKIYTLTNRFTATAWDSTGGVGGSGALRLNDGGWGFAIERPLNATPNTNFRLTADVLVHGINVPLYFQVSGLSVEPVKVQIESFATDFATIELTGITVNETGYIQIFGETGGGADTVWIDNLVFEDDASLMTYTLSGKVTLSDMPADMSGSEVTVMQAAKTVTTDVNGDYSVIGLIAGMYDIKFSHFGYKDVIVDSFVINSDATLDVTLPKNQQPIADAGEDIIGVQAGTYVRLDGSLSSDPDGDPLTYHWTSANPNIILVTSTTNPIAGFRPLDIDDFKFYLMVNDGTEDSALDSVMVSVTMEAPQPLGYEYVDDFAYLHAALGVAVDPEGKIWAGCYSYGSEKNLAVWNSDGTRPDWQPIMKGLVGTDTVTTTGNCYGMAVDTDGNIYFSNASEHVVMKFDYHDGTPLGGIRLAAGSPVMSLDNNGYLYVGTVVGDSVWIFDKDLNLVNRTNVQEIGRDLEVAPDGSVIYVGAFDGTVKCYGGSPTTGYTRIDDLPGPFRSSDGNGSSTDIGFDMHGRLWVTEEHTTWPQKDFMHIYSSDLSFRETFFAPDEHPWDNPRGTAFDHTLGDSLIYIVDFGSNNKYIQRWAIPGTNIPPTFYTIREVAAVDENGFPVLSEKKVRIRGIITVAGEFGATGPAYIQDAVDSAAVAIYDGSATLPDSVKIGDEIIVSGRVGFYNGLTEIDPPDEFMIVSSNNVITPLLITCADLADSLGERFQSQLVKIENIHTEETVFPSNANIIITDKTGMATMRIDKDTDIPGVAVQADSFTAVGVITQYDGSSPYWGGYQIMPRFKGDIPAATGVGMDQNDLLPKTFALHQNYPNPFNPVTTIKYDLPKDCHVSIQVFNILGQKVKTLVDSYQEAGFKAIYWNGLNDAGNHVATGTYIYMIKAADFKKTKRMTMIK